VAQGKAQNGGFGNQVVAKYDDGVKLQFSHLKDVSVKPGDVLEPGKQLASIGNTGNTYGKTGIHVDITGYKPDGTLMTAQEVAQYMLSTYA
jgi:murein DD-endopeptidase MepM/ murein hydrolase activator NlpD